MEPRFQSEASRSRRALARGPGRFLVEYSFQSSFEEWRGFSSPHDDEDGFRHFRNLSREYYGAAARESYKEAVVLGFVVVASLWPIIYMIFVVAQVLGKMQR